MRARRLLLPVLAIVIVCSMGNVVAGAPTVKVLTPTDGSTLLTHAVNVTGTAAGPDGKWFQGDAAAFGSGTLDKVVVNTTGKVVLTAKLRDDFNDNSFDTNNWTETNKVALSAYEKNKALHLEGKSTTGSAWGSHVWVMSTFTVSTMIQATTSSYTGSGGFASGLLMYQDGNNYVGIGTQHSSEYGSGTYVIITCHISGTGYYYTNGVTNNNPHTFKVTYNGSTARLYYDNSLKDTFTMTLTNPKALFTCGARDNGDTVDIEWDDFVSQYQSPGEFTSSVFDTRCAAPQMKEVDWTATTPTDTSLTMKLRSSNSSDMGSATPWASVSNGQGTGFPTVYRFLQYRANLTTVTPLDTPALKDVTIVYKKPLSKVEVSIDGNRTWRDVTGSLSWYVELVLPENSTTIWVRATDVTGENSTTSSRVEVDTTPPTGGVLINGGDVAAPDQDVALSFNATDHYGVAKVMIDDYPDFPDGYWQPYALSVPWHLPWGEGAKTVYAKFMDRNGWVSEVVSDTILLDTNPPVGSIVIDDGAEFTNNTRVDLTLVATDLTGVSDMLIGEASDLGTAKWTPFHRSYELVLKPGDGPKYVFAAFRDPLGHVSMPVQDSIILDTMPPTLDLAIEGGAPFTNRLDVQVGIVAAERFRTTLLQISDGPDLSAAPRLPFVPSLVWRFGEGDGTKTVYARAWDAAGNVGPVAMATIVLDTVPPVVGISMNGGAGFTGSRAVSVTLDVIDDLHATTMWIGEDPTLQGASPIPFATPTVWTLSEGDGPKTLFARVVDAAGNLGPISGADIVLDTTPPVLHLRLGDGSGFTRGRSVQLTLEGTDASTIARMQVGEDPMLARAMVEPFSPTVSWLLSAGEGPKDLFARAWDAAGNPSGIVKASIVLDTTPPALAMSIVDRQMATAARAISVRVVASDANGLMDITLGQDPSLMGVVPVPYTDVIGLTLTGPDGLKVVYGRVRDRAGNVAPLASASILLDTTPPVSEVMSLTPFAGTLRVHLAWGASDALTGVLSYDVQSRDGDGPWTDWLVSTDMTEGDFEGVDGHTYSFRVRSQDGAGNLEAFPGEGTPSVTLHLPPPPRPLVTITEPLQGATVRGFVFVSGTAMQPDASMGIVNVEFDDGDGTWAYANGTLVWSFGIDTTHMRNGPSTIRVRASDGQRYSEAAELDLTVRNPTVERPSVIAQSAVLYILLVLIASVVGVSTAYLLWKRRGPT
jgi:hypothetical protein